MKTNVFVKTKNVKGFVALMSELENLPLKIPKIALVTGDFGLGKSETIKWWSFKNDCIYVRANQGMSSRWLLSEIADELGEEYYWNSQATFTSIENICFAVNGVLTKDVPSGIYNMGDDDALSTNEMIEEICK